MEILIEEIYPTTAGDFTRKLAAAGTAPVVRITSRGGDVGASLAMANAIARHGNVRVIADGMCASAAILLLVAAKRAEATASTLLMIHRTHGGTNGNAEDLHAAGDALTQADALMRNRIEARVGARVSDLLTDEDVWLDPGAALEYGLIDEILEHGGADIAALLDTLSFDSPADKEAVVKILANVGPAPAPQPAPAANVPAPAPQPNPEDQRRTAIRAHGSDAPSSLVESVIASGITPEAALAIFTAAATQGPAPANPLGANYTPIPGNLLATDHHQAGIEAMAEGVLIRAGLLKDRPENQFRGVPLADLKTRITAAVGYGRDDFKNVLSNAANRAMSLMFGEIQEPWRKLCRQIEVPDFRETSLSALGLFPTPPELYEHAEIKLVKPSDTGETGALATHGMLFPISRQAVTNDDTAQFGMIAEALAEAAGRAAGDSLAALVASLAGVLLKDGNGLFHADRGNSLDPLVAITSTSLDQGRAKLAKLLDPGGIAAGARPEHIWCAESVAGSARALVSSEFTGGEQSFLLNPVNGLVSAENIESDYRLDFHNNESNASWYLLGRNQFVILLLRGQTAPMVDEDQPIEADGYTFRVLWDFRVVPTGHYRIVRGSR